MDKYVDSLDKVALKRCKEKCALIGGVDPYSLQPKDWRSDPETFAKIGFGDLFHYLVFGTSSYTLDEFKAYKSLQAFNQFVCGWVKNVGCCDIAGLKVFLAKVCYDKYTVHNRCYMTLFFIFALFDRINFLLHSRFLA